MIVRKKSSIAAVVALRKESVDRNLAGCHFVDLGQKSLSARRAWIEIHIFRSPRSGIAVALRKESVDRNTLQNFIDPLKNGRSPQGERG